MVSDLITETYQISPSWEKRDVYLPDREKKIRKDVLQTTFYFKYRKVDRMIKSLQQNLKSGEYSQDIMEQIMHFNAIKLHLNQLIEKAK